MSNSFEWWHWNWTLLSSIAHSNAIEIEMVANVRMHHPYYLYIRFTLRIRPLIGCMQSFTADVCMCVCAVGQSHRLIFINSMQKRIVGLHFVFVSQYFAIQVNYEIGYRFTSTASIILCNFIWFHSIRFDSFHFHVCVSIPFVIYINAIVDSLAIKITIMRVSFVRNSKTFVWHWLVSGSSCVERLCFHKQMIKWF